MTNSFFSIFDLYAHDRANDIFKSDDPAQPSLSWIKQVFIHLFSFFGILLGPFAIDAATGKALPTLEQILASPMHVGLSFLFAFIIVVAVFRLKLVSAKTPFVMQLGTALIAGLLSSQVIPKVLDSFSKIPG